MKKLNKKQGFYLIAVIGASLIAGQIVSSMYLLTTLTTMDAILIAFYFGFFWFMIFMSYLAIYAFLKKNNTLNKTALLDYLNSIHKREMDCYCGTGYKSPEYSPNLSLEIIRKVESGDFNESQP